MDKTEFVYGVDIVFCIDGTKTPTMEKVLLNIKREMATFVQKYADAMALEGKEIGALRTKIVVFRDFKYHLVGLEESKFFVLPDEEQDMVQYVNNIELTDGDKLENYGLEAIATALKSKWNAACKRNRQMMVIFSDKKAYPLSNNHDGLVYYPKDMPKDLPELGDWFEGEKQIGTYKAKFGRLVAFVPRDYPWDDICGWSRYWPTFAINELELANINFQQAIDILVGSF